jgi:hypothetical protein
MYKNGNHNGMFSWCIAMKKCLDNNYARFFSFVWLNSGVTDEKGFPLLFDQFCLHFGHRCC